MTTDSERSWAWGPYSALALRVATLTLVIDREQFAQPTLRLTIDDIPGSPAQVRPLLGP